MNSVPSLQARLRHTLSSLLCIIGVHDYNEPYHLYHHHRNRWMGVEWSYHWHEDGGWGGWICASPHRWDDGSALKQALGAENWR